jgi:hypothetical protein
LISCGVCGAPVPKEHEHDKHVLCKDCFDALNDGTSYDEASCCGIKKAADLAAVVRDAGSEGSDETRTEVHDSTQTVEENEK